MKKSLLLALVCWLLLSAHSASAQINLSFSFVSPACHGYTNGSATVTATGGVAPYSYHWGNGQSGQTNQGIGVGIYAVTVTDANSHTASGPVSIPMRSIAMRRAHSVSVMACGLVAHLPSQIFLPSWSTTHTAVCCCETSNPT